MRHNIEYKHFEPRDQVRKLIDQLITRLEKHTQNFRKESVFLRVLIEENAVRTLYHVTVTLDLPGRTLATKAERHDLEATLRDAFAEIERQVEKYKASLRGEQYYKRATRREEIRRKTKVEPIPSDMRTREMFDAIFNQHFDKLKNFVSRELEFHQKNGDLVRGNPTVEDVVDAMVLRAYQEFAKRPSHLEIDLWLFKLAIDQIEAEIEETKKERESIIYLDEILPEVPVSHKPGLPSDETEEADLPNTDLDLEQIFPDLETPLSITAAARREIQHEIKDAITLLPTAWWRAFVLRYGEGLSESAIAQVINATEDDVRYYIENVRQYLRERLAQFGLRFKENPNSHAVESQLPAGDKASQSRAPGT
jgi:ribosomal subunit interface protein